MADSNDEPATAATGGKGETPPRIEPALARARLVLLAEQGWRAAIVPAWIAGLYVAVSWLGLWPVLPDLLRFVLSGLFVAAFAGALVVFGVSLSRSFRGIDRAAAISRVERASGLEGRELAGFEDRPASAANATTRALWAAHRRRLASRLTALSVGLPSPDLGRRDRWALRPALALALFVGWFAAGDERLSRLGDGFHASRAGAEIEDRLDVWIDPPAYTRSAPVVLLGSEGSRGRGEDGVLAVPQGSRLEVRAASGRPGRAAEGIEVALAGPDGVAKAIAESTSAQPAGSQTPRAWTTELTSSGEIRVTSGGRARLVRRVAITADLAPTVRLVAPPETQASGSLRLTYEVGDDWGVVSGEAVFDRSLKRALGARPLVDPPRFPLALPPGGRSGRAETFRDLSAHPLAGAVLRLALTVRDEAGQEGRSPTIEMVLPQRAFRDPLARALVELRRRLALDARQQKTVVTALDALMLAPDRFRVKSGTHLGLHFVAARAAAARSDGDLLEVIDLLWAAALTVEGGDLSVEEKSLRDAQEALREALDRGASDEEITKATAELRKALENYLAALSQKAQRDPSSRATPGEGRSISDRDLQKMLDRIENLARTGSRAAAEKLLSQMREVLENLQSGGDSQGGGEAGDDRLDQLGDMIRRQQKLRDDTRRSGTPGETGGGDLDALKRAQEALRDELRGLGEPGGGGGEGDPLAGAGEAMGEAGEALGRGDGEAAGEAQGRALDGLRRGAQALAERQSKESGEGRGGAGGGRTDPLGRERRGDRPGGPSGLRIPEEIDVERARRILDDIRRRLGAPAIERFERDYLDRLLKLD